MAPKEKEGVVYIINIGKSSNDPWNENQFLEEAKQVVRRMIEKKMLLSYTHEVGVIALGKSATTELQINIQFPTWDIIEYVLNLTPSNFTCSWPEGLHVASENLNSLERLTKGRIVLIHDFQESDDIICQYNIKALIKQFKVDDFEYEFVGIKPLKEMNSSDANSSERLAMQFCEQIGVKYKTLQEAKKELEFFGPAQKNTLGQKVTASFLDISIPIAVYKALDDQSDDPVLKVTVEAERDFVDSKLDSVEPDAIGHAYEFGGKLTTMSDCTSAITICDVDYKKEFPSTSILFEENAIESKESV